MNDPLRDLFENIGKAIINYLPSVLAGLLLLVVGWFLGWFLKRITIRLLLILRLERMLQKFQWGDDFSKGDVRYALYTFIGNLVFLLVLLIFLNGALSVMNLTGLSSLLEKGILFLPRLAIALVIFAVGWFVALWVGKSIRKALAEEEIPRSALIARFSKLILLLFFFALALTELDIAREIVIIGYTTVMITLGGLAIVLTARGGKKFIDKILQSFAEE
jgi:hypothetical protein